MFLLHPSLHFGSVLARMLVTQPYVSGFNVTILSKASQLSAVCYSEAKWPSG